MSNQQVTVITDLPLVTDTRLAYVAAYMGCQPAELLADLQARAADNGLEVDRLLTTTVRVVEGLEGIADMLGIDPSKHIMIIGPGL
jgi:hypothetical protein